MYEPTEDGAIFITDRTPEGVTYYCEDDGRTWIIRGRCNQCGLCEVGGVDQSHLIWVDEPGVPGACIDTTYGTRLDNPIRPEGPPDWPGCSLTGEYLDGN